MRRPARPFTVEIKSSRRSSQKSASALTVLPRTAPSPPILWSGEVQDSLRERNRASLAAFEEANRLFAKLTAPTPASVPAQRSDALSSEAADGQDDRRELMAKAAPLSPSDGQDAGRPGSLLPDLRGTALELGAPPQDTDQRSAPRNRRPRRKASKEA